MRSCVVFLTGLVVVLVTLDQKPGLLLADSTPAPQDTGSSNDAARQRGVSLRITRIAPLVKDDTDAKEKKYLQVNFLVTALAKPDRSTSVVVRFACKVGDDILVKRSRASGSLDDLDVGESTKADASAWINDPLDAAPSWCTLSFGSVKGLDDPIMNLGQVCFTPPAAMKDSACPR